MPTLLYREIWRQQLLSYLLHKNYSLVTTQYRKKRTTCVSDTHLNTTDKLTKNIKWMSSNSKNMFNFCQQNVNMPQFSNCTTSYKANNGKHRNTRNGGGSIHIDPPWGAVWSTFLQSFVRHGCQQIPSTVAEGRAFPAMKKGCVGV